ncbi:phospholipase D-like domain-containing protein [Serratia fonticola]|uniref:phospholipase D-like domain-containing protein n=1 Tax=Serratia fonticola TaxID=47917 RepID=UPI001C98693A|nr:phospholipase D-like domain-containing protein [Serratia fonticola]
MTMNLNDFQPSNDGVLDYMKLENNNVIDDNGVSAYFRDIEKRLIEHIESANSVFGAIAWLTNGNILNALSSREHVQVVVQKEDFLRPDRSEKSYEEWKKWLHSCYSKLKCSIHRGEFEYWILGAMSLSKDYPLDPGRCVGYNDTFKKGVLPRMHNKFLVFANVEQVDDCGYPVHVIEPYAVWTGSFNFSKNATHSLENALYITNKKIVDAYFREYTQIAAISEKLDWTSEYIKPEWNIGV